MGETPALSLPTSYALARKIVCLLKSLWDKWLLIVTTHDCAGSLEQVQFRRALAGKPCGGSFQEAIRNLFGIFM
jgi:hypothetical protein